MKTRNLILRRFEPKDLPDFIKLIQDKMSAELSIYDEQYPTDEESIRNIYMYFMQSQEFFAVELQGEKRVIGFVSLNVVDTTTRNLGFCIHSSYQHRGYASEAVTRIIEYAQKNLSVQKLVSGTAEQNIAAVKLLQNMRFALASRGRSNFANDHNGNPIVFTSLSFERML